MAGSMPCASREVDHSPPKRRLSSTTAPTIPGSRNRTNGAIARASSSRSSSFGGGQGGHCTRDRGSAGSGAATGRLKALCEVLDLDFYVGPRRQAGAIDVGRLREAIASTERTLGVHGIALQLEARADAIAAVYDLLDRDRAPATAERVRELIEALGRVPAAEETAQRSESEPSR